MAPGGTPCQPCPPVDDLIWESPQPPSSHSGPLSGRVNTYPHTIVLVFG